MLFKNIADAASQLASRIQDENLTDFTVTYINPDSKPFADLVSSQLHKKDSLLLHINSLLIINSSLVIIDDGSTPETEFDEFSNRIRQLHPTTRIILAVPIILESKIDSLKKACDSLIYLTAEPIFFSLKQFYSDTPLI